MTHSPLSVIRRPSVLKLLILVALITSCTVQLPYSYIYAQDEVTKQVHQWPIVKDENSSATIEVEALPNVDEMLPFTVTVTNKNKEELELNPQDWKLHYFTEYYGQIPHADTTSNPLSGSEINRSYREIADRMEKAQRTTKIVLILTGVVIIAGILILAAANAEDNAESEENDDNEDINFDFGFGVTNYASPGFQEWSPDEQIDYFRSQSHIDRGDNHQNFTIAPGATKSFTLFYPRKENFQFLIMEASVDSQLYSWDFFHRTKDIFR